MSQLQFAHALGHGDGRLVRYWQRKVKPKVPGVEYLSLIAGTFGFEPQFFEPRREGSSVAPQFHKASATPVAALQRARAFAELAGEVADEATQRGHLFGTLLEPLPGVQAQEAAKRIRSSLLLGVRPIENLVQCLESVGVLVLFSPSDIREVHAYSDWVYGRPLIMINPIEQNRYRARFLLAHELGHIVLHVEQDHGGTANDREREADQFATELLMPANLIVGELRELEFSNGVPWQSIARLKEKWGVEMSSILKRAIETAVISESDYQRAMYEYGRRSAAYRRQARLNSVGDFREREPGRRPQPEIPSALAVAIQKCELIPTEPTLAKSLGIPQQIVDILSSQEPTELNLRYTNRH
jgi:Zn-dependent peptidase ImmA (M78 family)